MAFVPLLGELAGLGGMCSMLPYDTDISVKHLYNFFLLFLLLLSIPFLYIKQSSIDKFDGRVYDTSVS